MSHRIRTAALVALAAAAAFVFGAVIPAPQMPQVGSTASAGISTPASPTSPSPSISEPAPTFLSVTDAEASADWCHHADPLAWEYLTQVGQIPQCGMPGVNEVHVDRSCRQLVDGETPWVPAYRSCVMDYLGD